jgi:hypothetical protein
MRKREKPDATTRSPLVLPAKLAAGLAGLGGVGAGLWLVGPAASYFLGLLFLLALVGVAGTAIFSKREEPIRRLMNLIRVMRGRPRD